MTRIRCVVILLLAISLAACSHEENKDYAAMNKIPMHAVCVGRMLVDLPKGNPLAWQQQFDYAKVSKLPTAVNGTEGFWEFINHRKAVLSARTSDAPNGRLNTFERMGKDAVVMQYGSEGAPDRVKRTERYVWLGHWGYEYKTGDLFTNEAAELLERIKGTFSEVHPINNVRPPDSPGFCIDSALVTGKIGPIWSGASVNIPQWKDVSVSAGASEDDGSRPKPSWQQGYQSRPIPTPYDMLADRESFAKESERSSDSARIVSMDVLRKQDKTIAGMLGQETAFKLELANGQKYYRFDWSSIGDAQRPNKSGFSVSLIAGDDSYTPDYAAPPPQEDLLALWDTMLDSVKPRPAAR